MEWKLQTRTWCKIITSVNSVFRPLKDERKTTPPTSLTINFRNRHIHSPVENVRSSLWSNTFSPLRKGKDRLLTSDVRVLIHFSYMFVSVWFYTYDDHICLFIYGIIHGFHIWFLIYGCSYEGLLQRAWKLDFAVDGLDVTARHESPHCTIVLFSELTTSQWSHTDVLVNWHSLPLPTRSTQRHGSDIYDTR